MLGPTWFLLASTTYVRLHALLAGPGITALSINPQWWWSAVFMPAAGGLGWLAKYGFDRRQADRTEVREDRSEEWSHILEMNNRLTNANQGLEAKVAQFDPTLAQIQKEFRDGLTREMEGLAALRDLRVRYDALEANFMAAERRIVALEPLSAENQRLRSLLDSGGIEDDVPKHSALPWDAPSTNEMTEPKEGREPWLPEHRAQYPDDS